MDDHHSGLTTADVWDALTTFIDRWERAGCDCCAPTPLDEALGDLDSELGLPERVRRIGIELAVAGEWAVQRAAESAALSEERQT